MEKTPPKYQYGFEVPRDYADTVMLDKKNDGNTRWQDAVKLKLKQLKEYNVFTNHGIFHITKVPSGYQVIKLHLVFAVKHDGRHKARMVADGHLTHVPLNSVYAGVLYLYKVSNYAYSLVNLITYGHMQRTLVLPTWKVLPKKRSVLKLDLNSDLWQAIYSSCTRHCTD